MTTKDTEKDEERGDRALLDPAIKIIKEAHEDERADAVKSLMDSLNEDEKNAVLTRWIGDSNDTDKLAFSKMAFEQLDKRFQEKAMAKAVKDADPGLKPELARNAIQGLNTQQIKDAVPPEARPKVAENMANSLDSEEQADLVSSVAQHAPPDVKPELAKSAYGALNSKQKKDLMGSPDQNSTNKIWLIVIWCLAIVLVLSVACLVFSIVWEDTRQKLFSGNQQMMLTVVTTVIGFFGGLFANPAHKED